MSFMTERCTTKNRRTRNAVNIHFGPAARPMWIRARVRASGSTRTSSRDVVHAMVVTVRHALDYTSTARALSAAADLTWRARAPEEATRRGLLPRLLSVVLRGSGGNRRHHRRRRSLFYRGCGAGRAGQGVVFLEAALFVFAARTAWAGLVAPRSSNRPSSHRTSVHPCYGSRSAASGFMRPAVRAGR